MVISSGLAEMARAHHRRALIVCYYYYLLSTILTCSNLQVLQGAWSLAIDQQAQTQDTTTAATQLHHLKPSTSAPSPTPLPSSALPSSSSPSSSSPSSSVSSTQRQDSPEANIQDGRRPIWNMAHMVNSIKELDYRLGKGANAIEVDVTFGREGDPLYTYHGPPCDCWRHCHQQEDFGEFLRYVRDLTLDEQPAGLGANLSLMLLDLKLKPLDHRAKGRAGSELAKALVANLYGGGGGSSSSNNNNNTSSNDTTAHHPADPASAGSDLRVVLSVNHVQDVELVNNFLHQLEQLGAQHLLQRHLGFDVGMNDDLDQIEIMWRRFGGRLNLWQGDGFTNCLSPFYNLQRLSQALVRRNQPRGYPRKVYQWTVDLHERMREALRLGVDAVMTNHPERLVGILGEPEMLRDFRLATKRDDPFAKLWAPRIRARAAASSVAAAAAPAATSSESARYQRSAGAPGGGLLGGLMDMLSSWFAYLREIPLLSLPTTSRLLSGSKRHKSHQLAKSSSDSPEVGLRTRRWEEPSSTTTTTTTTTSTSTTNGSTTPADTATATTTTTTTTTTTNASTEATNSTTTTSGDSSETPAQGRNQQASPASSSSTNYDGPTWYASLASNLLVSAMKFALPADT